MRAGRRIGTIAKEHRSEDGVDTARSSVLDGSLVIDCRACPGVQDLSDQGCMRCALGAMVWAQGFDRVLLSRSLDVAYEGRCIQVLRELSEAVRLCRSGVQHAPDRPCQGCGSRPSLVLGRLADSIPYGWSGLTVPVAPLQSRAKCATCTAQVNDLLSTVMAKLRSAERSVSREAFMVVGESGNA